MSRLELEVAVEFLDQILGIVKDTIDHNVMDVVIRQRVHLSPLKLRHPALGRQHKHPNIGFRPKRVFGSRAGVTGGRTKDVERLGALLQHMWQYTDQYL